MDRIKIKGPKIKTFVFTDSDADEYQSLTILGNSLTVNINGQDTNSLFYSNVFLFILLLKTLKNGWKTKQCLHDNHHAPLLWFTAGLNTPYGPIAMEIPIQYWSFLDIPESHNIDFSNLKDTDEVLKSLIYGH